MVVANFDSQSPFDVGTVCRTGATTYIPYGSCTNESHARTSPYGVIDWKVWCDIHYGFLLFCLCFWICSSPKTLEQLLQHCRWSFSPEQKIGKTTKHISNVIASQTEGNMSVSVCLPACLAVCPSVCLCVCVSVCLRVCTSLCVCVSMSVCVYVCMGVWLYRYACLPACLPACMHACMYVCYVCYVCCVCCVCYVCFVCYVCYVCYVCSVCCVCYVCVMCVMCVMYVMYVMYVMCVMYVMDVMDV